MNWYKFARTMNTFKAIKKGRVIKRFTNIAKGKVLAKIGFWKWLWG
jgi:hypothetical protein